MIWPMPSIRCGKENCPYDTVCYHAQQCAEKYLKALLVHLAVDFPKIHDIGELIQLLPPNYRPSLSVVEAELLTDFATASRYPGDEEPIEPSDASEAVAIARRVREVVQKHLSGGISPW